MVERATAAERGRAHRVTIGRVPRILTGVLGILFLAGALVYVFSARLVLTPTLTCQTQRPSLCRVWVNERPDPVIAAVLLVIAGLLLLMAITGRGWVFSFAGASIAPATEAAPTAPEDIPSDSVEMPAWAGEHPDFGVPAGPGARAAPADAYRGMSLFTLLPQQIRNTAAAKWASWYPDSPIGIALEEVRMMPGQPGGPFYLRLRTPQGEDRWLKVSGPQSR